VLTFQHSAGSSKAATELNGWLRSYSRSPIVSAKEIRAILDENKELFYACAFRVMRQFDDSAGSRFLAGLLLERGLLLPAFCDPALPDQRVRGIIQAILAEDAASDLVLVKAIVDQALSNQTPAALKALMRVINNLEKLTDARRIVPRLLPLLRHPDLRLRSKVVRIVGCCGRNKQWVARQLADADPRIRANAVEGLWGIDDPESRELLRSVAHDDNNRVVGNALLGLYRAGDCEAITALLRMAAGIPPLFRATAAWVMGETGDPRFRDALKTLAGVDDPVVRKRAAASLSALEAEAAKPELNLPWRVAALGDPDPPESEEAETGELDYARIERRVRVAVQCADGSEPPPIPGTQLWISEDKQPVLDYCVETLRVPNTLVLAFLIPLAADGAEIPAIGGALRALIWKRPRDAWAAVRYRPPCRWNLTATLIGEIIEIAPPEEIPLPVDPPVFAADGESAAAALQQPPEGPVHRCIWDAIVETNLACAGMATSDAESRMVVYCPCDVGKPAEHQAHRLSALDLTVPIHCIARAADPFLEDLCGRSQGSYQVVDGDAEAVEALETLHIRMLARYSVTYRGMPDAATSHIQLHTPEGSAKAVVRFGRG
jgi:hypothetical protein